MSKLSYNTPEDLVKKLQIAVANERRLNKDKKITLRVTSDTYEELEIMARLSGANLSRVTDAIIKEHLQLLKTQYEAEGVEE